MKYTLIILMASLVAILGCTQPDKQNNLEPVSEAEVAVETSTETDYEAGAWITDFNLAKSYAKELERPILINFTGSDWCRWCFKLRDEVFSQDAFTAYAKKDLVLLTLDFPQKKQLPKEEQAANEALAQHYGIEGFPTILLVDAEGIELARTGYQPGGAVAYVQHLTELLSN